MFLWLCLGMIAGDADSSQRPQPDWKITLKVGDQDGVPISSANITVAWIAFNGEETVSGLTGQNGTYTAAGSSGKFLTFIVEKDGYYPSRIRDYEFETTRLRRWMPWNPTVEIELKEIRNPVPMYAKSVNIGLPELDVPLGYDMERGDWVPPHGSGRIADFVFTGVLVKHDERNYDHTLTVQFSNEGDGIIDGGLQGDQPSWMKSDHLAPESGYLDEWVQYARLAPGGYRDSNQNSDRIYYYRVRTKKDESGNVISANYGKIYGDFLYFIHYFNPDGTRNVEFDPKKNLVPPNEVNVGPGTRNPGP